MNEEWQSELGVLIGETEIEDVPNIESDIREKLESINLDGTKKQHEKISDELLDIIDEHRTELEDWFETIEDVRRKLLRMDEDD